MELEATIEKLKAQASALERNLIEGRLQLSNIVGQITALQAVADGQIVKGE